MGSHGAALFVAMTLAAPARATATLAWTVDCTRGQSISRVLEHAPPGLKLRLIVRGTCNEAVLIDRDDVTLQGGALSGAVINAPPAGAGILVRAMRVVIERMTLERGGITVYGVSDTYIIDTTIRNVAGPALMLKNGHAFVSGCTLEGSGQGVILQRGSARLKDCQIRSNFGAGISATSASGLNVSGSTVASNGLNGIGSKLNFVASATTSGRNSGYGLQCQDAESSVVGLQMLIASPPNGQADVSPACTGF